MKKPLGGIGVEAAKVNGEGSGDDDSDVAGSPASASLETS
jgi:hypothetical protein